LLTETSLTAFSLPFLIAYVALAIFLVWRLWRGRDKVRSAWLGVLILGGMGAAGALLLPENGVDLPITRDFALLFSVGVAMVGYCGVVLRDMMQRRAGRLFQGLYFVINALWLALFAGLTVTQRSPVQGWIVWAEATPTLTEVLPVLAIGALSAVILFLGFYFFRDAVMPEVANRAAFFTITGALVIAAAIMLTAGSPVLYLPGTLLLLMGVYATVYACYRYRLIDVRNSIVRQFRTMLILLISWGLIFALVYLVKSINLTLDMAGTLLVGTGVLLMTVLLLPVRQIIEGVFGYVEMRSRPNLAAATAEYSQNVARASNLEEVVNVTTETLNRVMRVHRSALILVNNTFRVPESVELLVMEQGSSPGKPTMTGFVGKKSPIFQTLAIKKVPLTQFDVEYGDPYRSVSADELAFLRRLSMHAYIPIVAENALIGLLSCGPKLNDTPYSREDMEMLMVIAQQVGTALRSARLIDDLQHLNNTMRALNKRLESAKTELEKLDSIKTDFITIASHELRTPLAQIRGYTDIIDSMNEQNLLKTAQTSQFVANLRKSTERMEELISNMLDVSQIDVNALDLRFVHTSIESIIRMAFEPMKEAAEQRKITVERGGFDGLPAVHGDMQRLVQAFRNILVNAVKYTPDGGRIDITAKHEPARSVNESDQILVTIKDTGVGVATKDHELIFQKFYRGYDPSLHSTGMYKFMGAGPGLGLTIARGIITGHGGSVWVESPGHDMKNFPGSAFYIRIPVNPPAGSRRVLPFDSGEARRMPAMSAPVEGGDERATAPRMRGVGS
jgi:signal transduction histidine kinase